MEMNEQELKLVDAAEDLIEAVVDGEPEEKGLPAVNPRMNELSIRNGYFSEVAYDLDRTLQGAAHVLEDDEEATVTLKIKLTKDSVVPDFANGAKFFCQSDYEVGLTIKKDGNKFKGHILPFGTKTVDGHMLLINPDRQMELDEIVQKAEQEVGNVPPEKDLMEGAPLDPEQDQIDAFDR